MVDTYKQVIIDRLLDDCRSNDLYLDGNLVDCIIKDGAKFTIKFEDSTIPDMKIFGDWALINKVCWHGRFEA